ncbi:unnamed protein product [Discosporangium mesarthrocarpum]
MKAIFAATLFGGAFFAAGDPRASVDRIYDHICYEDEALDSRTPAERVTSAREFREDAAADEYLSDYPGHITNGDEFGGDEPIYAALFHKTPLRDSYYLPADG